MLTKDSWANFFFLDILLNRWQLLLTVSLFYSLQKSVKILCNPSMHFCNSKLLMQATNFLSTGINSTQVVGACITITTIITG